jgi:hypothetical protein
MNKRRIVHIFWPLLLVACTEQPQTIGSNSRADTAAFQGTGVAAPFTAAGWKGGDKTSWESHLKTRTEMGQNDYNKVP